MKKNTQKAFRDPATQQKPRKLQLATETLRVMSGGGRFPEPEGTSIKSQCPTMCYE